MPKMRYHSAENLAGAVSIDDLTPSKKQLELLGREREEEIINIGEIIEIIEEKDNGNKELDESKNLLTYYMEDMGKYPLLTPEKEIELGRIVKESFKLLLQAISVSSIGNNAEMKDTYDYISQQKSKGRLLAPDINFLNIILKDVEQLTQRFSQYCKLRKNVKEKINAINSAATKLTNSNSRLVVSVAKKYRYMGLDLLDLIQEGTIGLMKVAVRFNYEAGYKFSTYATWWIRQGIVRALADQSRTIRTPVHVLDKINRLVRIKRGFFNRFGRWPTPEESAEKMGCTVNQINKIQGVIKAEAVSYQDTVNEEAGDNDLMDFIKNSEEKSAHEAAEGNDLSKKMRKILATLSPREEMVIRKRYAIGYNRRYTLQDIGDKLGITRERIRQIEAKAFRKLRHYSRAEKLREFLQ